MAHDGSDHGHHIIPMPTLLKVFGALILLTILTVVTARYIDFGFLEMPIALAIATTKATLVVAVFMALMYDKRVNVLTFVVCVLFVLVFLGFTLLDTVYRGDVGNMSRETVREIELQEELLREREPPPETQEVAPGDPENGEDVEAETPDEDAPVEQDEEPQQNGN